LSFVQQAILTLPTNPIGNSTFAGATAAIIANIVLIGYVVVAMREDAGERADAEEKEKKSR
jgi:archaellum component FlaF (FlaF/FlaG flagellin family)